eukprot:29281-Pelagococcus_subviridis.AAC.5
MGQRGVRGESERARAPGGREGEERRKDPPARGGDRRAEGALRGLGDPTRLQEGARISSGDEDDRELRHGRGLRVQVRADRRHLARQHRVFRPHQRQEAGQGDGNEHARRAKHRGASPSADGDDQEQEGGREEERRRGLQQAREDGGGGRGGDPRETGGEEEGEERGGEKGEDGGRPGRGDRPGDGRDDGVRRVRDDVAEEELI